MLSELSIENFAIIDQLRVRFGPGLTAVTGETGAGKSILIDALQAALGSRTSSDMVREDTSASVVEAIFDMPTDQGAIETYLADHGIEAGDHLILRRDIHGSGRSTARINGRAVPLSVLEAVGSTLVDIHGQSDHLSILKRDRQRDVLDEYGNLHDLRSRTSEAIGKYVDLARSLRTWTDGQREAEQRLDLLRFQVQEIESAAVGPDEEDQLLIERNLLVNAERLAVLAASVVDALQGEPGGALDPIHRAVTAARELASIDARLTESALRLDAAAIELDDIHQEVRGYRDVVEYDPRRLAAIEERLDAVSRLKRKYGSTAADVLTFGATARSEMEEIEILDTRLDTLGTEVKQAEARAGALAGELSGARTGAAGKLMEAMSAALDSLALNHTRFVVSVAQRESDEGLLFSPNGARYSYTNAGTDSICFLVSFNPGEPPQPFEKVASGGETSRFLLALKSVLAMADPTNTLIFDEVDAGVGGRGGAVVGERLRDLSGTHQVISITHLPQVAAQADSHLRVSKSVARGRTAVTACELDSPGRIREMADMMSGTDTEAARRNAQELYDIARSRSGR